MTPPFHTNTAHDVPHIARAPKRTGWDLPYCVAVALFIGFMIAVLAGCASPGPIYRGAPPPGMTDQAYRCQLVGQCGFVPNKGSALGHQEPAANGGGPSRR